MVEYKFEFVAQLGDREYLFVIDGEVASFKSSQSPSPHQAVQKLICDARL